MLILIRAALPMSPGNTRLRREIYAIVIIKLLIIFGLWWVFIRDARVEVDGQRLAEHLAQPASDSSGDAISLSKRELDITNHLHL